MTATRWCPTVDQIADDIRANLEAGDETHALRMLMDGVNRLPDAAQAGILNDVLAEPASTGDPRWDALLAASIRYRLHSAGYRRLPVWTHKEPLDTFWWPAAYSASKAYNDMAHTPAELMRLGIFLDDREFTTA